MAAVPFNLLGFESLSSGTYQSPSTGSTIAYSHTPTANHKPGSPVLVLLHGWPQTRYIWRYAIPPLVERGYSLFVPDLPGYGSSTMSTKAATKLDARSAHDRVSVGTALLEAIGACFGRDAMGARVQEEEEEEELKVVLVTHDRGSRIAQRLVTPAASSPTSSLAIARRSGICILGAMMIDIVPYFDQWSAFANPRAATTYGHWSFLPTPYSIPLVKGIGGGRFCRGVIEKSAGSGRESVFAGGALDHYAQAYESDEVIRGAAADYAAGAAEDYDASKEDLEEGRKIQVPVTVLYSQGLQMISGGDVDALWRKWIGPDVAFECHMVGDGVGHYIPEEAPEVVNSHIAKFLKSLGV